MRPFSYSSPSSLLLLLLAIPFVLSAAAAAGGAPSGDVGVSAAVRSAEQQAANPGDFSPAANTVPAFPLVGAPSNRTCRLDLSDELFGGVAEACGGDLDRSRCCPVLAAWLFTAHARSALEVRAGSPGGGPPGSELPMMPDDSQRCVDALQGSLRSRGIRLARPNATCDAVLCFCGIRLHQISSLSCPAAFNLSSGSVSSSPPSSGRKATPTAAVRELERSCRNSSYAGCTRCLESLDKLMDGVGRGGGGGGRRADRVFGRDCQLMGLTWLLARNRTAYIPTVSAVLRAILYSSHPPQYRCSPDQENMPLAVDSLEFERLHTSAAAAAAMVPARGALRPAAAAVFSSLLLLRSSFLTL